jgi:hypothetical protein
VGIYGRKAKKPLTDALEPGADSWAMLGTNLSVKVRIYMYTLYIGREREALQRQGGHLVT